MNLFSRLKNLKIILIDDDEWIRDAMRLFFEDEGCALTAVETAEEAIAALGEQAFDIIIADYRLPGMDGIDFFEFIHKGTSRNAVKILITAYLNRSVRVKAKKAGVHDLIEKPFKPADIEESLSRLLKMDHLPSTCS